MYSDATNELSVFAKITNEEKIENEKNVFI